jgi:hypothetical protein
MHCAWSLGDFVASLLREVEPTARLLEFNEFPSGHYTMRIETLGETGNSLVLSRRFIEDAVTRPGAFRALRFILRSEVLRQRSGHADTAL